ncbi:MAG TPA: DUF4097 family beta strand repeat-containing protein [Vicinamibacteria bacterium]|nr:DUF4097 family beta strand repeat-containing protein [Vicinamibacteria bacterium]
MRVGWLMSLAVSSVLATPVLADEWSHQYPVKGVPEVHVKTDDGNVQIAVGTGAQVEAKVTTVGWRIAPEGVTVTESQTGDRVDIAVRLPRQHFSIGHHSVTVALAVPKQANLVVHTGDGSIGVEAVSGRLDLSTGDGSVSAKGLAGDIRMHTGDGSIHASGLDGRLTADTGDGHLTVQGRFELLDLGTGDGGIEAEAAPGSKVASAWSLHSGDGSITLRLPEGLGAEVDATTGDGHIQMEAPLGVTGAVSSTHVHGNLGAGGPPLRIHTGDGSIRLQAAGGHAPAEAPAKP